MNKRQITQLALSCQRRPCRMKGDNAKLELPIEYINATACTATKRNSHRDAENYKEVPNQNQPSSQPQGLDMVGKLSRVKRWLYATKEGKKPHLMFAWVSALLLASALARDKLGLLANGQTPQVQRHDKWMTLKPTTRAKHWEGISKLVAPPSGTFIHREGMASLRQGHWL